MPELPRTSTLLVEIHLVVAASVHPKNAVFDKSNAPKPVPNRVITAEPAVAALAGEIALTTAASIVKHPPVEHQLDSSWFRLET
jgi:hypothetical protein